MLQSVIGRDKSPPEISLIVPMYNEEENCDLFFDTVEPILENLDPDYEIVCVNDGSRDRTFERLLAHRSRNPRIKVVNLSRNFGKEAALTAGLDLATGRAVVPIDADLQDPPELLADMVAAWRAGAQVVLARRIDRSSDSPLKRATSAGFYYVLARMAQPAMPNNVGDFRLMDRTVVEALKRLPERSRFMKGLFAWVGYRQVTIDYVRQPRAAGATKFNYLKLWNFALDGIVSFSSFPLKVWSYFGFLVSVLAVGFMVFLVVRTLLTGIEVPGYASTMSVILFFNGMVMISLGVIGEYVSRIFVEVKGRPIYLINEIDGFDGAPGYAPVPGATRLVEPT
ncbi:glycosyltransferase family 2 protein [Chthonobacter rhizosphaerae]|uniref:glycosyltransferase family 2 protein n=1 Tax=Chthonobacter rhizosphaerae TaxID=2735553 RepID=UPI0015EE5FC2|nr:glycosyltransferase family 2 protein [Chthonobacter rhizosphaerae]